MVSWWKIILPSHNFDHPSHWYYGLKAMKRYEFGITTNGTNSIPNFMKIQSAVLESL
jgi:hypothetical protein